jgi:ribonucleoside-triphosphate reductase
MDFPTPMQEYIYKSRYARYVKDEGRRENWPETVDRYIQFYKEHTGSRKVPWELLREGITSLDIMPSMRSLMTAGPALARDNVAGYNCAYVAVDSIRVFDEIMYVLMCGTGVGFSVERQYIAKLPEVAEEFHEVQTTIDVGDSKIGWASAFRQLVGLLYQGQIPRWNLTAIRPAGAILQTFGGRASGPEPLGRLFGYCVQTFRKAKGRRLTSLEVHDIVCKIAEVVVVGGVRRSALLSLSNLTDQRMAGAKAGNWYDLEPQRRFANNSVAYTETPDIGIFMKEWQALYESKSGERGIFNRVASDKMKPERREGGHDWGTNPCSEIVLRSKQFCNLSEVVLRKDDTCESIKRKVELATILGTVQASLTGFRYLSSGWRKNTEEEALLGVSLTGIMDNAHTRTPKDTFLSDLRKTAIETNQQYSKYLGINPSAAITCVKPSGTVSQLVDAASGIHPRYAPYYVRRVRADTNDPLCGALDASGIVGYPSTYGNSERVYEFPVKSPEGATVVNDLTAINQLEHWKTYAINWCEHKPSISVYVREHEWLEVGAWCYKNFDVLNGVSFFPMNDHIYQEAPYEEISQEKYSEKVGTFPSSIDLNIAEESDVTTASQEVACQGGQCEL